MSNEARAPLIQLPSGVCLNLGEILFIARKELNQYMVVYASSGIAPNVDGKDMDVLKRIGFVQEIETPAAANEPVIAPTA